MTFSAAGIAHKAIYAGVAALTIGAGSLVLHLDHNQAIEETRTSNLEIAVTKLSDVPITLATIQGKIDVLAVKLDAVKEAQQAKK